jgi:hypothetical protein
MSSTNSLPLNSDQNSVYISDLYNICYMYFPLLILDHKCAVFLERCKLWSPY